METAYFIGLERSEWRSGATSSTRVWLVVHAMRAPLLTVITGYPAQPSHRSREPFLGLVSRQPTAATIDRAANSAAQGTFICQVSCSGDREIWGRNVRGTEAWVRVGGLRGNESYARFAEPEFSCDCLQVPTSRNHSRILQSTACCASMFTRRYQCFAGSDSLIPSTS